MPASRCDSPAPDRQPDAATVTWRNVVIGMAVYNSATEALLLQAAADTWLRMARGVDLVLMTDSDDPRDAASIAPTIPGPIARVHVYRCADCRSEKCESGGGADCAGVREGWLARRKVLHLFVAMARRFSGDATKSYFLKVDPDTVPLPHNLLRLLIELRTSLGAEQPYYFGMAACRVTSFPLCHASGGAGYGLSRAAVHALQKYLETAYPAFLGRVDKFTYGGEDVAVAFALKKQCGASVINTGCLYQHSPLKYAKLHAKGEEWVQWPLSTTPASFHKFKDAREMRTFFSCALYDARGKPRPAPRSLFVNLSVASCDDAWSSPSLADGERGVVADGGTIQI